MTKEEPSIPEPIKPKEGLSPNINTSPSTEQPSRGLTRRQVIAGGTALGVLGALGVGVSRLFGRQSESPRPTPGVTGGLPAAEPATATAPAATETPRPAPTSTDVPATATLAPREIIPTAPPATAKEAPPTATVKPTEAPPTPTVKPTEVVAAPRPEWIQAMPPVKIDTDPKLATRPLGPITHIGINTPELGAEAQNTLDEGISYGISMWEQVSDIMQREGGPDAFKYKYLATAKLPKVDPDYKPTYKALPLSALPEGANLDLSLIEDGEFDPTKQFTIEYSSEPQLIPLVGQGKSQDFGYTWRRLATGEHKLVVYSIDWEFKAGTVTHITAQDSANKQYTGIINAAMARTSLTFGRVDQVQSGTVSWDGRYFVKNFSGQVGYDTPGWEKMYTKMTGPIKPGTMLQGPFAINVTSPSIKK